MNYAQLSGWESTLLADVRKLTGQKSITARTLDNLHARYIALVTSGGLRLPRYDTPGGDAAATAMQKRLSADTGLAGAVVRAWAYLLYTGAKSGKIPEAKYDPVGAKQRRDLRAAVDPSLLDKAGKGIGALGGILGKVGIGLAVVGVLGLMVYTGVGKAKGKR